jgi:hypothetical protein
MKCFWPFHHYRFGSQKFFKEAHMNSNKSKVRFLLISFLLLFQSIGYAWRSPLYPEDWFPGFQDSEGRFLHDFSYAGYHSGEDPIPDTPPGPVFNVTQAPYNANRTGANDATSAIQRAINDAGNAGGGIVYLPSGTYSIKPQGSNSSALRISKSNVVLRGDGPTRTKIYVSDPVMRQKQVINVSAASSNLSSWFRPAISGSEVYITTDLLDPTTTIPLVSVSPFNIGDWVILRGDVTPAFITEHFMDRIWTTAMTPQLYYRRIVDLDPVNNTITIDAPTRYYLKTRDNARVYKIIPHIEEVGIENLAIGMQENLTPGRGDQDYSRQGTAAYQVHNSKAIYFQHVVNGWIRNVQSYKPVTNTNNWHILSIAMELQSSRSITVENCRFRNPEYRGGGGNGYHYFLAAQDVLITGSSGEYGRHNYTLSTMIANGNVIHRSKSVGGTMVADFHRHLAIACLVDNLTLIKSAYEARNRGTVGPNHGHSTTQTVFWNVNGEEAMPNKDYAVWSSQYGWGYVIGTQGAMSRVKRNVDPGTEPEDYVEGEGAGSTLEPPSLYEDQLANRLAMIGR